MKRVFFLLGCISAFNAYAQDVIVCRDGEEIESKVLKISQTEVEYKKWTNQDGPLYTLDKSKVFMIKYQNGEKDVFKEEPAVQQTSTTKGQSGAQGESAPNEPVMAVAASDNEELIAEYNNAKFDYILRYPDKKKEKKAELFMGALGVTASSILSTDDIEISFKQIIIDRDYLHIKGESVGKTKNHQTWGLNQRRKYAILIRNKTARAIYVDKAACFAVSSIGTTKTYFDSQEYTVTEAKNTGSGASVNLGSVANALGVGGVVGTLANGVSVGGNKGTFNAATTTHKDNRILTVPPHASVALSEDGTKDHPTERFRSILTGSYEYYDISDESLNVDEIKNYSEENTPKSFKYMITYSFEKEFNQSFMVTFGTYLKSIFGATDKRDIYGEKEVKSYIDPVSSKAIVVM